jgi:hypothetical protein
MASGKAQSPVRHATPDAELFEGSFAPDTANAPTTLRGSGFTVTYVSAGRWTVTIQGIGGATVVKAIAGVQLNAAAASPIDVSIIGATASSSGNLTFDILYRVNAVATNIAANANNRVHFSVTVRP